VNAAHAIEEYKKLTPTLAGKIIIQTVAKNESILISIQDNGSGIPVNIQDKIFDPFFTTKRVGKGTGQGLSIAYDVIVNKLNGKIWFESEISVGTTFYLQIPCQNCKE
jgi:signal transduction histidine kinase